MAIAFLALSACSGGSGSTSRNDSTPPVDAPSVDPPPSGSPAANSPPRISGAPVTVVAVGKPYEFAPQASDTDGDALEFSVSNLPPWAQFNTTTGRLSGIPGQIDIGKYSSISISVSDGKLSATLPEFAISVENQAVGWARLKWKAPTRNEDGSKLRNLAGFRIYFGQDSSNLASRVEIPHPHVKTARIEELTQGTWYFAVTAYTTAGIESSLSMIVSKTIG
jgi:Putative Ig domain